VSEDELAGRVERSFGRAESELGKAIGSHDMQADGAARQVKGQARKLAGKVQQGIDKAADQLSGTIAKAGERTRSAYDITARRAQEVAEKVRPVATERPYAVAGGAFALGLLLGMLLNAGGPKIIYVKPRD
jgi:uncharacterized protein YjbJ (UPF0337 family)